MWGEECIEAFLNWKIFLSSPPLLSSHVEGEVLFLCLFIMQEIISFVLVLEDKGEQIPVYYASEVLKGAELNYPPLKKLTIAVLMSATKLRPYFESQTI